MISFISISKAKQDLYIPEYLHPYIPDVCPSCGHIVEISTNLTIMKCTNPECPRRLAKRIVQLLKALGIKSWGQETIVDYIHTVKITDMIDFLQNPPISLNNIVSEIIDMHWDYPTLVYNLYIPHLGMQTFKIFAGCNSLADFCAKAKECGSGPSYIATKIGGNEAPETLFNIIVQYAKELAFITDLVKPALIMNRVINIAITGNIQRVKSSSGSPLTKQAYVDLLNRISEPCDTKFRISGALHSVMYIIADSPSNTHKYNIGLQRKNIITSDALLQAMQKFASEQSEE